MKLNNLKIYYILIFINNLWFITSNWLSFWLKFMTLKDVGKIDSIAFLIGILFEFPSGVISDKVGRKQTLLMSQSLLFLGCLIIYLASNLYEIGLGFILFQIGISFFSGTIESFGYESCNKNNTSYDSVLVKSGFLNNSGYLFSLVIGGYIYLFNENLPNLLMTLNFFFGIIFCLFIREYQTIESQNITKKEFKIIIDRKILLTFVGLMTIVFSFDFGFLKLIILEKFSNLNSNYWYIFAGTVSSLLLSSILLPKIENYLKTLGISIAILVFSFLLTFYTFIPLFFVLSFLAIFIYQLSLKYLNGNVEDSGRAGFISLFNLFYKLPYVLIALILGYNLG